MEYFPDVDGNLSAETLRCMIYYMCIFSKHDQLLRIRNVLQQALDDGRQLDPGMMGLYTHLNKIIAIEIYLTNPIAA